MPVVEGEFTGVSEPQSGEHPRGESAIFRRRRLWKSSFGYFRSLIEASRWQLAATVALMTLTSLTEGIGVALLFPILGVAGFDMHNQGHVGHYTGEVLQLLRRSGVPESLWLPALLMLFMLLMAVRSLFLRAQSVRVMGTVLQYQMRLSRRLYQTILQADWLYLVRHRASDLTHALTGEMSRVAAATYQVMGAFSSLILVIVYTVIALKLSALTTLMVLGAGAGLLTISRRWLRAIHESGEALSQTMSEVYAAASEHLQNLKTVKSYGEHESDLSRFGLLERSAFDQHLRSTRNQAAAAFWFEAGSLVVLGAVIFVSLRILNVGSASILLLLAIFTRLMPRLATANGQVQAFLADLPAFDSIQRIYEGCRDSAETLTSQQEAPRLFQHLDLRDVSFQYAPGLPPVLNGVSLSLKTGEFTALVGVSGSGKSTIADLLIGLLTPASGQILVDGVALTREAAASWRSRIGYVAQDTVLFHDTVRANLLWSRPGSAEAELAEALRLASADFVFDLPKGLDTIVGDRGILLSNGQRQRLALARALLRKPSLLILDEATNHLDVENEQRILDAIEGLIQRPENRAAVLLIAHRPSAVQRAGTIYILEDGHILASGGWEGLRSAGAQSASFPG